MAEPNLFEDRRAVKRNQLSPVAYPCKYCGEYFHPKMHAVYKIKKFGVMCRPCREGINRAVILTIRQAIAMVPLTQGKWAIIDADDVSLVVNHFWQARESHGTWYVEASANKRRAATSMHRLICHNKTKSPTDHIDHDGLNNRKINLRIATNLQNALNRRKVKGKSQFRGVSPPKCRTKKWAASIKNDGQTIAIGWFDTEEQAARAYDRAALAAWGADAPLNFPPPGHRFCGRATTLHNEVSNG